MNSRENDRPSDSTLKNPKPTAIRHTLDCKAQDEIRLRELAELFDGAGVNETLRLCIKIVHAQAAYLREKKGNRVVMESEDGKETKILYNLELLRGSE